MNLLLFEQNEIDEGQLVLNGRRADHVREVLRSKVGDYIRIGQINGDIGRATIREISTEQVLLREIDLRNPPPPPSRVSLIVALPRPKSLPRLLQTISSLGVKNIHFINASKVEKYFWSSDYLAEETVRKNLLLGLEQSVDTVLPEVHFERLFKPFAEDRLPALADGKRCLIAHPYVEEDCPFAVEESSLVAVGPEGGWIDFEIEKFRDVGFQPVRFGGRILRLETAVTTLVSRLSPFI